MAAALGAFVLALMAGLTATAVQWRRADANAEQARDRSWVLRAQAAQAALAEGDGFRGLRDLVANLGEMEAAGRAADVAIERQRIGTLLANAPQLVDLARVDQGLAIHALAISPQGTELAIALHSATGVRSVRMLDVATGGVRWTTSTEDWPTGLPFSGIWHGWLRFTPDGSRLLATMPHQSPFPYPRVADSMPLDARDGTLLRPPFAGPDLFDLVASDDGRLALVRWRADPSHRFPDTGQFHRIDDWTPIGPRHRFVAGLQTDAWLPAPDGSAWLGTSGSSEARLHELGSLALRWRIALPPGDMIRGWRFSADGRYLALGTADGRVLLVDPRDGAHETLRATPASPVRWLEFDAAARTLAARAEDGTIAAWDVVTREPRVMPITGPAGETGAVHVHGETLYAAVGQALHAWTLPPRASFDNLAIAAPARIRNRRDFAPHAFDVHAPSRLLAMAGTDGSIGLWRVPPPALQPPRAAPLPSRTQFFDGRSVVSVDGTRVQLRELFTAAPLSPAWSFPDPVRIAERSHDGRRLAVVAGRTLRVLDTADGTLVGTPIVLPQSPLRVDLAAAAPVLALTTGEYVGDSFRERIHVVDLEQGALRAEATGATGPIQLFALDPTGRRLVVGTWQLADSSVHFAVVALDDTPGCPAFTPAGINAPGDLAFAGDGRTAWMYASLPQRQGALLRLDLVACAETARLPLQQGMNMPRLLASGDAVIAHRQTGDMLSRFEADGRRRDVPGMTGASPLGVFALDAEGRRAVLASRNAVQLVDLARGEQLSGLLAAPISGDDAIAAVLLSPDAGTVLARSFRGRWLAWRLPTTTLSLPDLQRLATVLEPRNADPPLDPPQLTALRAGLRARDNAPETTAPAQATIEFASEPAAASDPRFVPVDLTPAVNAPLNGGGWPVRGSMGGDTPTLPMGPQRLHGIDWRVDGGVQLSWGGAAASLHPTQRASAPIPVPRVAARRVHVLMAVHIPIDPRQGPSRAATVVLRDAAGGETSLEVQMTRDVVTRGQPDLALPSARIGWIGVSGPELRGGEVRASDTTSFVYAVSLDVPAGTPPVHELRLETRDGPMEAPLFYAVTLERDVEGAPTDSNAEAIR
jgi:WD40 repeat protein